MLDNVLDDELDPAGRRRVGAAEGRHLAHRREGAARGQAGRQEPGAATSSAWSRTRRCAPQRLNALRTADTRLQRADPQYATRAGSNNAHFLLPRPRTDTTPQRIRPAGAQPRLRGQRHRRLRLVPPERAAEGDAAGQRAARTGRAPGARARDAGRRRVRAALPAGQLRRRSRRRCLGRRIAAQGHARLLQRVRPGGVHVEGRQPVDGADGRRAHAARGCSSAPPSRSG